MQSVPHLNNSLYVWFLQNVQEFSTIFILENWLIFFLSTFHRLHLISYTPTVPPLPKKRNLHVLTLLKHSFNHDNKLYHLALSDILKEIFLYYSAHDKMKHHWWDSLVVQW